MSYKTVRFKWARKVLKAKMFVVLTEKESCIAIDGADPFSLTDSLALAAQTAELEMFRDSLNNTIRDHKLALDRLSGVTNENNQETTAASGTAVRNTTAKATKQSRPVRAGTGDKRTSRKATPKKAHN